MAVSERGQIPVPDLDDRRWQDLVDEARELIPDYAPQWTNHNPSDVGITLIELFAWMVETLIYRLNRVPEKNFLAFLNLLGIQRDPPTPARAWLTFRALPTQVAGVTVPAGTRAQTQGSETEPPIAFETDEPVLVLPTNLETSLLVGKVKYWNVSGSFTVPPADGELITIESAQAVLLCFGFDAKTALELGLRLRLFRAVGLDPLTGTSNADVDWLYSRAATDPTAWPAIPNVIDETNGLQRDGLVRIVPPADWAPQAPAAWTTVIPASTADAVTTPLHWIGLRISNLAATPIRVGINFVLFNSASSHNALSIPTPETLGEGDGSAFQRFELANAPVFERPDSDTPYDHLQIEVSGTSPAIWTQVDDLPAGAGNVYKLDPVAGTVSFGNYDPVTATGHGSRPATGSTVTAPAYRYAAGGAKGNVGAGTITALATPIAGINDVTNLFASYGGSDEELLEDAKRRAPVLLRTRNRAVTGEDYEYLASEATTDVRIVRCLEPRVHATANAPAWEAGDPWTFAGIDRSPGNVNVIVVPDLGRLEPRPMPSKELVDEVLRDLDKRRDITARLHVTGPRYLPVRVVVDAYVWQRAIAEGRIQSASEVYMEIKDNIEAFLHPVNGGADGRGWRVGQHVFIADLFAAIVPPEEVGYIASLTLAAQTPAYHNPPLGPGGPWDPDERPFSLSTPGAWVRVADYELVCFGQSQVTPRPTV